MTRFFQVNAGKSYEVIIREVGNPISTSLRKYYFMIVVRDWQMLLNEAGYRFNRDQTHEYIKQFSPIMEIVEWHNDELLKKEASLTETQQKQFMQYIEDLKAVAAEFFGHYIEDLIPN